MQPRFTVLVDFDDGVAVDASLSESSKAFLRRLAAKGDAAERGNDVGYAATGALIPPPPHLGEGWLTLPKPIFSRH